jgi:hypothetical protein
VLAKEKEFIEKRLRSPFSSSTAAPTDGVVISETVVVDKQEIVVTIIRRE